MLVHARRSGKERTCSLLSICVFSSPFVTTVRKLHILWLLWSYSGERAYGVICIDKNAAVSLWFDIFRLRCTTFTINKKRNVVRPRADCRATDLYKDGCFLPNLHGQYHIFPRTSSNQIDTLLPLNNCERSKQKRKRRAGTSVPEFAALSATRLEYRDAPLSNAVRTAYTSDARDSI